MQDDIRDIDDIKLFVDEFYAKVQTDELLAPIFGSKIEDGEWEKHLNKMYSFWETVLFHKQSYKGSPFMKHYNLPIESKHFNQWVALFSQTIDENFRGEKAVETKGRAAKMALMFESKMNYYNTNPNAKPIV